MKTPILSTASRHSAPSGSSERGDAPARPDGRRPAPCVKLSVGNQAALRRSAAPAVLPSARTASGALPLGNQAALRRLGQPLAGAGRDALEREADDAAERVGAPTSALSAPAIGPAFRPSPARPATGSDREDPPSIVGETVAQAGEPLPPAVRALVEPALGQEFADVRVHADAAAARSARAVAARAYAIGRHIVFGEGGFGPHTPDGARLVAHELAHVAQQRGGPPVVQRSPLADKRFTRDETFARYRGEVMAKRVRNHGLLSAEARAKIAAELAYFEGRARDIYVEQITPALKAVKAEDALNAGFVPMATPPRPIEISTLPPDPRAFSDDQIYAELNLKRDQEKEELEKARKQEADILRSLTKGWGPDQEFALNILARITQHGMAADPRGVNDAIRKYTVARYERWLRLADKQRADICAKNDRSLRETIRQRANNDDICVSWFATEYSHGPSELAQLGRVIGLMRREPDLRLADRIYRAVLEYRKNTDPAWLQTRADAEALVNAVVGLIGGVAGAMDGSLAEEAMPAELPPEPQGGAPAPGPNPTPIEGGGETTPPRGSLRPVGEDGTLGPARTNAPDTPVPGPSPANDNAPQQDTRAAAGDPSRPRPQQSPSTPKTTPAPAPKPRTPAQPLRIRAGRMTEAQYRELERSNYGVYVYRLVDTEGNVLKWGTTTSPLSRVQGYRAATEFYEMEVMAGPIARPQALSMETTEGATLEELGQNVRKNTMEEMKGGGEFYQVVEDPALETAKPMVSIRIPGRK